VEKRHLPGEDTKNRRKSSRCRGSGCESVGDRRCTGNREWLTGVDLAKAHLPSSTDMAPVARSVRAPGSIEVTYHSGYVPAAVRPELQLWHWRSQGGQVRVNCGGDWRVGAVGVDL
jgi:hypothetical protein